MSNKERPFPKPPKAPFGRGKLFEKEEKNYSLLADQMLKATAEGKLDEFLKNELPDNEFARKLTLIMAKMTGILSPETVPVMSEQSGKELSSKSDMTPPEDVVQAAQFGDVKNLMELLLMEHKKRTGDAVAFSGKGEKPSSAQPTIEKTIIDQLIKIANDNDLSVDWLILKAIKRYIQEYQKTGKL